MTVNKRSWTGLVGAAFFGMALSFAMGANNPKGTAYPRYTVSHTGPFVHITDNDTNKEHVYVNEPNKPSKYLGYVDLAQVGSPELKATKAEDIKDDKTGK